MHAARHKPGTEGTGPRAKRGRRLAQMLAGPAFVLAGLGMFVAQGSAASASNTGTTTANVAVSNAITLSALTPSFTLSGDPGTTVTQDGAVTMNVDTNNATGYTVSVQPTAANLVGTGSNSFTIPVGDLQVRETGQQFFSPLNPAFQLHVYSQDTPSAAGGDNLSNDYQIQIPDGTPPDTYSVTLDYVAATQ